MNFRMDNRQTRRMLEKMGMNLEELPNVEEVIIKTKERDLIIKEPQVSQIKSKAMNIAFDVTPAKYVTGLITEKGVCEASTDGLKKLFK